MFPHRETIVLLASLGVGVAAGCGSFNGTDTVTGSDASVGDGSADGGTGARNGTDASALDSGAPAPCTPSNPKGLSPRGLWVVGGQDTTNGGGSVVHDILRAPIRCDGSLAPFQVVPTKLPTPGTIRGAGALLGDTLVLLGGFTDPDNLLTPLVRYASFDSAGQLSAFNSVSVAEASTFRPTYFSDGTHLVVAGGDPNSTVATLWTVQGGKPAAAALPALLAPAGRGAGIIASDKVTVIGAPTGDSGTSPVWQTSLSSPGVWKDLGSTGYLFDCGSAATDKALFIASGYFGVGADRDVTVLQQSATAFAPPIPHHNVLPAGSYVSAAAISNGFIYVVGGSDAKDVSFGALTPAGDDLASSDPFALGPPLPTPRLGPIVFVR